MGLGGAWGGSLGRLCGPPPSLGCLWTSTRQSDQEARCSCLGLCMLLSGGQPVGVEVRDDCSAKLGGTCDPLLQPLTYLQSVLRNLWLCPYTASPNWTQTVVQQLQILSTRPRLIGAAPEGMPGPREPEGRAPELRAPDERAPEALGPGGRMPGDSMPEEKWLEGSELLDMAATRSPWVRLL